MICRFLANSFFGNHLVAVKTLYRVSQSVISLTFFIDSSSETWASSVFLQQVASSKVPKTSLSLELGAFFVLE